MTRFFLGLDGGQSSTSALIGDERGEILGASRAGPCHHTGNAEAREQFLTTLRDSIGAACSEAGLDPRATRFESACLGFSGGPEGRRSLVEQALAAERLTITTDAEIALTGATGGAPGIIVIAGTGSIAFGRDAEGRTARTGGWGYLFGDEGGAFDLVRQALRASLAMEEGWGPRTSLHAAFLDAASAASANELLHRFYTDEFPRSLIASYAPLVDAAAADGDDLARQIIGRAASDLAGLARAVRARLFGSADEALVAYVGGVFRSALLLAGFRAELGAAVQPPLHGPAAGALIQAYLAAGLRPDVREQPDSKR
jgi:N-acetylglucosamine kinase-like BadF-type ATPase